MSKTILQFEAINLRKDGYSIGSIAEQLRVSKSSVSWWVKDVVLTNDQKIKLAQSEKKGKALGRLKSIQTKRDNQKKLLESYVNQGIAQLRTITIKELFVAGIALYWSEGGKSERNRRVEFCNSDPEMIKFILLWFEKCFDISKEQLICVVGINQAHKLRDDLVKDYWSEITQIPLSQFRKTSFKKVQNRKVYENFNDHFGTLTILVSKSTNLFYQIRGLIKGLGQIHMAA